MTVSLRSAPLLAVLIATGLLLGGCAPATPATGGDSSADGGTDTGSDAGTDGDSSADGPCPTVPQEGYELFTTDYITAAPEPGAVYSASNPIEFGLSRGAGYYPSVEFAYVNDAGDAITAMASNLLDNGDGTYYQDLGIFDSLADGRPGFATVTLLNDDTFTPTPGDETFDSSVLGRYCISYEVE